MQITLVHNPDAGDTGQSAKALQRLIAEAGHKVLRTLRKDDVKRGLEDTGELVVAAGGDGTVKRVALALTGRDVPLAILPVGTANNIAKSFGIFGAVPELAAKWATAARRPLRIGTVESRGERRSFVESVGAGVFAELISRGREEVDENAAGLTGHAIDRALSLLERIVRESAPRRRRLLVGDRELSGDYLLVQAMNIPFVGPNVPLAPQADCGDGLLDVVAVTGRDRGALVEYLCARLTGTAATLELPVHRAASVTMEFADGKLQVDDDEWEGKDGAEATVSLGDEVVEVLV